LKPSLTADCDCVIATDGGFSLAQKDESNASYTLGVKGLGLLAIQGIILPLYGDGQFSGYEVYNSCVLLF